MVKRFGGSVRARLTLIASVVMALLCIVVNSLLLYAVNDAAVEYETNRVTSAAMRVIHLLKRGELRPVVVVDVYGAQVVNSTGQVVSASPNFVGRPRIIQDEPDIDATTHHQTYCDMPELPDTCLIVSAFRVYQDDGDWVVYAFGETVPWYVHPWGLAFLIGITICAVAITWYGTSHTIARTLAPVDAIRAKLADITATDLGQRVPVPDDDDEINALARTANQTLDRLEAAVEQQRRFASDASHDLRSPITAMRAQVEETLLHPEDADWPHMAEALLASLDRLQAIVTDLLILAKLDAGAPTAQEPVDLAELVSSELATRHGHKEMATDLRPGVTVVGDRLRLSRLLANLLDNAERHAEKVITIKVRSENGDAVLEVLDDGAGIAPEQREVVFQRFTRLDASRNRDAGGTGLGLPIAREIAQAHGGTLRIADSAGGARFILRLPGG